MTRPKAATTERLEMTPGFPRSKLGSTALTRSANRATRIRPMAGWKRRWTLTIHWVGTKDSAHLRTHRTTAPLRIVNHSTH